MRYIHGHIDISLQMLDSMRETEEANAAEYRRRQAECEDVESVYSEGTANVDTDQIPRARRGI